MCTCVIDINSIKFGLIGCQKTAEFHSVKISSLNKNSISKTSSKRPLISSKVKLLFVIVLILGFILKLDVWTSPDIRDLKSSSLSNQKNGEASSEGARTRSPASISNVNIMNDVDLQETFHSTSLTWDCSPQKTYYKFSHFNLLRLNGNCLSKIKSLKNTKNGYTANLFAVDGGYTTDFLSLEKGENELKIEWLENANKNAPEYLKIQIE